MALWRLERQRIAFDLRVTTFLTGQEIAERLGVSRRTAHRYVAAESARRATEISRRRQEAIAQSLAVYRDQQRHLRDRVNTPREQGDEPLQIARCQARIDALLGLVNPGRRT